MKLKNQQIEVILTGTDNSGDKEENKTIIIKNPTDMVEAAYILH